MGNEETTIAIPLGRYEDLIDTETRTAILSDYIKRNSYADRETMMRILGYPADADKIKRKEEEERKSFSVKDAVEEVMEDAGTD